MRKIILFQVIFVMATILFISDCYAQAIQSGELIKDAKQYDGKKMTYRGEVVGDIMIRGEFAWLNINDGSNAIGIWINKKLIKDIQYIGDYQAKGDIVEVNGTFNSSCPQHGGDLDIHAQSIKTIGSGGPIYHTISKRTITLALVLLCIIVTIFLVRIFHPRKLSTARFF